MTAIDDPTRRNIARELESPDLFTPPRTDSGTVPNLRFSFADAHNRRTDGGWAREVTQRELPIATTLAGVNMRLNPGGVRELHWHKEAEWGFMLFGSARLTAVDEQGRSFVGDVGAGDVWLFPSGIPHSIQGLEHGCEFLLVFDDGNFSENETFLLSDWLSHVPRRVLAQNFGVEESELDHLPKKDRWIFAAGVPGPLAADRVTNPQGALRDDHFVHRLMDQQPIDTGVGTARILDSSNFPIATTIAAALVEVKPGAMREMHWHPNTDEWQYFIEGKARMTVFDSPSKARTFDYSAGDVGYVPFATAHYVQNTGNSTLRFLELFKSDRFADVSLTQWLALTPHQLVADHLHLSRHTISKLSKEKRPVIA
jgi:oxalate decarboxylase